MDKIQELASLYGIQFYLTAKWNDSRLEFSNLQKNASLNQLSEYEESLIWTPSLQFEGAVDIQAFGIEYGATIQVEKHTSGKTMPISNIYEGLVYNGSHNTLSMVQFFKFEHNCNFQLKNYPFDHQGCELTVSPFLNLNPYSILPWFLQSCYTDKLACGS